MTSNKSQTICNKLHFANKISVLLSATILGISLKTLCIRFSQIVYGKRLFVKKIKITLGSGFPYCRYLGMVERMRVAWGGGFLARISRIIRLVWGAVSEAVGVDWVDRGKLKGES